MWWCCAPKGVSIAEILEISRFKYIFPIHATVAAGLAALSADAAAAVLITLVLVLLVLHTHGTAERGLRHVAFDTYQRWIPRRSAST